MTPEASQPCVACGEPTAPGKRMFVGRRVVPNSTGTSYLCASCDEEVAVARRGKKLTDEQLRNWVENGAAAGITWSGDPGLGSGSGFGG